MRLANKIPWKSTVTIIIITARKRSLGQGNIFTPVCHSVHRGGHAWLLPGRHVWLLPGGVCGCSRGVCVVAPGGERAWLLPGGVHGCSQGGMRGCSAGCVVAPGEACVVALGGCVWLLNERAVRVLLECILVHFKFKLRVLMFFKM